MSIYGDGGEGLTPMGPGAKVAGPVATLQAKWASLDEKQQNTAKIVGAVLVVGLLFYVFYGSTRGAETWDGAGVGLVTTTGGACASGTSEGFGAQAVSTSNGVGEASCGPCLIPNADINTKLHCNRDYTFGNGYKSFFTEYAGRKLTLIQDSHDPDDIAWTRSGVVDPETGHSSTLFATVTVPAGSEATFHCFVPVGCQPEHAHTPNEYPNMVDPQGGWTESSESYMEDNGIERKRFFKKVTARGEPIQYPLHHTIHKGWGYVYLVELQKAGYCPVHTPPANKIIVTDLHAGHACGPIVVPYPSTCTFVHCDRSYQFGNWEQGIQLGYTNWNSFFVPQNEPTRRRNLWLIQDAHDPNDVADLTSQVDPITGLVDPLTRGTVTTCLNSNPDCKFVRVHIPAGYTARIHAFVPLERNCRVAAAPPLTYNPTTGLPESPDEQHAHTQSDLPNSIDSNQGWTNTGNCFSEDPGYHLTTGYCRGGPLWQSPHQGAGELWDCSPTGAMDGGTLVSQQGPGMTKNQCQAACSQDFECGAFDTEAHTETGRTRAECCLFKSTCSAKRCGNPTLNIDGPHGDGADERHCWVKGTGENEDSSIRPRGHFFKDIDPTTAGVRMESPTTGMVTESTGTGTGAIVAGGHYSYDLYHTVHTGWGYVYIVELCGGQDGNQCQAEFGR